jgi:hypothetical protein
MKYEGLGAQVLGLGLIGTDIESFTTSWVGSPAGHRKYTRMGLKYLLMTC